MTNTLKELSLADLFAALQYVDSKARVEATKLNNLAGASQIGKDEFDTGMQALLKHYGVPSSEITKEIASRLEECCGLKEFVRPSIIVNSIV